MYFGIFRLTWNQTNAAVDKTSGTNQVSAKAILMNFGVTMLKYRIPCMI